MDRVSIVPQILGGKPCVRGTRLSVELIVGYVRMGWTYARIIDNYPHLTVEDIKACVEYDRARSSLSAGIVEPMPIDRDLTPREAGDYGAQDLTPDQGNHRG